LNLVDTAITGTSTGLGRGLSKAINATVNASGTTSVAGNTPDNCEPDNAIPGCT
jgi:hypothetical protein